MTINELITKLETLKVTPEEKDLIPVLMLDGDDMQWHISLIAVGYADEETEYALEDETDVDTLENLKTNGIKAVLLFS